MLNEINLSDRTLADETDDMEVAYIHPGLK